MALTISKWSLQAVSLGDMEFVSPVEEGRKTSMSMIDSNWQDRELLILSYVQGICILHTLIHAWVHFPMPHPTIPLSDNFEGL